MDKNRRRSKGRTGHSSSPSDRAQSARDLNLDPPHTFPFDVCFLPLNNRNVTPVQFDTNEFIKKKT